MGFFRTYLTQVVFFVVLGLWIPMRLGIAFLDPVVLGAYACLGVVYAAPAAAGVSVLRAVLTGIVSSWVTLLVGIAVVYWDRRVVVGPDLRSLAECAVFGATLTAASAMLVSRIADRQGAGLARIAARVLLLVLLGIFFLRSRWLPDFALTGAAISSAAAVGLWLMGKYGR